MKKALLALLRRLATSWRAALSPSIKSVGRDVHIGAGCRFWARNGITVGDQTYVGRQVTIETNARIGRYVLIGNRVALVGRHDHDYSRSGVPVRFGRWIGDADADAQVAAEGVIIDDDVWVGFGAIVLSGVRIGRGPLLQRVLWSHRTCRPTTSWVAFPHGPWRGASRPMIRSASMSCAFCEVSFAFPSVATNIGLCGRGV